MKNGRPRVRALELPAYPNMDAMSNDTKIPKAYIKKAVAEGCKCLRGGKYYLDTFLEWWFAEDDRELGADENWKDRRERAQALREEIKLQKDDDTVIDFPQTEKFLELLVNVIFFGEVDRMNYEFPTALKGKSELEISEEMMKQTKRLKESLRKELLAWKARKGKEQ